MSFSGSRSSRALPPQLGQLMTRGSLIGFSEAQLLEEFLTRKDGAAFEAIVTRHGPMVLKVCRQLLRDPNDVEDAFQATFIILIRRASGLKRKELLGNWLYGVAYRVASRSRSEAIRRGRLSSAGVPVEKLIGPGPLSDGLDTETLLHLHQAILHLPDRYRIPIVLCYFEGLTHEEAAERLGWPLGSVKGRLSRARDLLRKRLDRRGVGLTAVTAITSLDQPASAVVVPHVLKLRAARSALAFSGESALASLTTSAVPLAVATLAQGVIRTMVVSQIRAIVIPAVVGIGIISTGASVVAFQQGSGPAKPQAQSPPAASSPLQEAEKKKPTPVEDLSLRRRRLIAELKATDPELAAAITEAEERRSTKFIQTKLEEPISMDFGNETPIEDVLKYIQAATSGEGYSGIPIYVDPAAFQEAGKTIRSPIRIRLEGVPLRTTLRLVLRQLGLSYEVRNGILLISSPDPLETAELEAKTNERTKQILKKLENQIEMDFNNDTPIEDILKYIQSATSDPRYSGVPIYVDPVGLAQSGKSLTSPVMIKNKGVPLKTSLTQILKQLGLAYCVHDGFVFISNGIGVENEVAQARAELELQGGRFENRVKGRGEK